MHSVTKMIGGHSDLTLGAVVGDRELDRTEPGASRRPSVRPAIRSRAGSPCADWRRSACGSIAPARRRSSWPAASSPTRASSASIIPACRRTPTSRWRRVCLSGGFGAIVTIDLGTRDRAQTFIRNLAEIPFAPSLGDVQTTLCHPASTSHRGQSDEQLARQGISAGMIRLSVGIEDAGDLWREFQQALDALSK